MRALPCDTKGCRKRGAEDPNGDPYFAGQYVSQVWCSRCRRLTRLSAARYNALPDLTLQDFDRLARKLHAPHLAELPLVDLQGAGFQKEQAADLFRAGFRGADELAPLVREAAAE